jgi:hypothetical protein
MDCIWSHFVAPQPDVWGDSATVPNFLRLAQISCCGVGLNGEEPVVALVEASIPRAT